MIQCGIYKITNLINNLIYVGQARDIKTRWRNHRTDYLGRNTVDYNNPLYKDMRLYGLNNFSFEILEECLVSELDKKEKYWISYYDSFNNGYNRTEGGQNAPHAIKMTDEIFNNIVNDLKNTLDNSDIIGARYNVSGRTIRAINSGASWRKDYLIYPIRPSLIDINRREKERKKEEKELEKQEKLLTRPHGVQLAKEIIESSFTAVGKKYGVSANAVVKWCIKNNIPHKKKDLIEWYKNYSPLA